VEIELDAVHLKEELGGVIDRIAVSNEGEILRQLREFTHDVIHGDDRIPGIPCREDVVGSNDLLGRIGEEKHIVILSENMDIGFVTCLYVRKVIGIEINHIFNQSGNCVGVVDNGLMGDYDTMNILHDIADLPGRKAVVDVIGENKAQSVLIHMNSGQIHGIRDLFTIGTDLIHVEFEFTVVVTITVLF
jgi:hypothetical protein